MRGDWGAQIAADLRATYLLRTKLLHKASSPQRVAAAAAASQSKTKILDATKEDATDAQQNELCVCRQRSKCRSCAEHWRLTRRATLGCLSCSNKRKSFPRVSWAPQVNRQAPPPPESQ